jgi:hypothetical protein
MAFGCGEHRVECAEVEATGVLVHRHVRHHRDPGERTAGSREVGVEVDLRSAPGVDGPIGAERIGVQTRWPPRLSIDRQELPDVPKTARGGVEPMWRGDSAVQPVRPGRWRPPASRTLTARSSQRIVSGFA